MSSDGAGARIAPSHKTVAIRITSSAVAFRASETTAGVHVTSRPAPSIDKVLDVAVAALASDRARIPHRYIGA
jgi:hypothetical protein